MTASERVPSQHYGNVALLGIGHGFNYAVCAQQKRFIGQCAHVFGHGLPDSVWTLCPGVWPICGEKSLQMGLSEIAGSKILAC